MNLKLNKNPNSCCSPRSRNVLPSFPFNGISIFRWFGQNSSNPWLFSLSYYSAQPLILLDFCFRFYFLIMCMCVGMHTWTQCQRRPEEGFRFPIVRVTSSCESHDTGAGNETPVLLADLFLQLLFLFLPSERPVWTPHLYCCHGHHGLWHLPLSPVENLGFLTGSLSYFCIPVVFW